MPARLPTPPRLPALVVFGALTLTAVAAGCGGGGSHTNPPAATTTAPATTAPATTAPATTAGEPGTGHQSLSVTPASGLRSGQSVRVVGTGFQPGETGLIVTECADKGTATGPGDCNLTGAASATADSTGKAVATLTVTKGPFGANRIVCGPTQRCLISMTQASPSPTEEADAAISFAP